MFRNNNIPLYVFNVPMLHFTLCAQAPPLDTSQEVPLKEARDSAARAGSRVTGGSGSSLGSTQVRRGGCADAVIIVLFCVGFRLSCQRQLRDHICQYRSHITFRKTDICVRVHVLYVHCALAKCCLLQCVHQPAPAVP